MYKHKVQHTDKRETYLLTYKEIQLVKTALKYLLDFGSCFPDNSDLEEFDKLFHKLNSEVVPPHRL